MPNIASRKLKQQRPNRSPSHLSIFISYAREDRELVGSIENLLKDTFEFAPLNIHRDAEIKEGQNWAKQIDTALQEADILLVIFTDRMKNESFLYGIRNRLFQSVHSTKPEGARGVRANIHSFLHRS